MAVKKLSAPKIIAIVIAVIIVVCNIVSAKIFKRKEI